MNLAADLARKLSPRGEFLAVMSICLGFPIFNSFWFLWNAGSMSKMEYTNGSILLVVLFEILSLCIAWYLLVCRGWRLSTLNYEISLRLTGGGLLLLAIYYGGYPYVLYIVGDITGHTETLANGLSNLSANVSLAAILVWSAVNAFFEETVVTGYVIKSLEKEGAAFAITVSTLLRFSYHTYQGPFAVVSILPLALLFGFVYWHWGRLWPLIFAHFLADVFGLVSLN